MTFYIATAIFVQAFCLWVVLSRKYDMEAFHSRPVSGAFVMSLFSLVWPLAFAIFVYGGLKALVDHARGSKA